MKVLYFICIAIIFSIASCTSAKETMEQTIPLYDTRWVLKKIYTDGKEETVSTKAFLRFNKEKGSAGGNGSCNSFGSNATVDGNEVSFKNIFSTKMYCEDVQKFENKYFDKLGKITRYEIKNKSLTLYQDKEKLLEFTAEDIKTGN